MCTEYSILAIRNRSALEMLPKAAWSVVLESTAEQVAKDGLHVPQHAEIVLQARGVLRGCLLLLRRERHCSAALARTGTGRRWRLHCLATAAAAAQHRRCGRRDGRRAGRELRIGRRRARVRQRRRRRARRGRLGATCPRARTGVRLSASRAGQPNAQVVRTRACARTSRLLLDARTRILGSGESGERSS